ncbi:MAG: rhodanese-like domain-containing protein [Bacteroidetes bacterium]|nr:MAG: rhodanese-like domain-containing protein [Bacteroidota bacterium]
MSKPFHIRKRYLFLMALAIILSGGLIFLPEASNTKELSADQLLLELDDNTRFMTVDDVADLIINQDPALLLVDLRSPEEYEQFSMEGAVNIPFEDILNEENDQYLKRVELQKVFYANNDEISEQAWVLLRRVEYQNIFVMKGGLTEWVEMIMKPVKPLEQYSQTDQELYNRRMAARRYFAGGSVEIQPDVFVKKQKPAPVAAKKKVKVIPKKVVEEVEEEEGC